MRVPIYRVRSDGGVDTLGDYDATRRALRLTSRGYPLTQVGEHIAPGALPWVFFDVLPSGFLGRRFAHAFAQLRLPPDASRWNTDQALRALCEAGHDLAGDLLLGDETLRRFERIWGGSFTPGPSRDEAPGHFARFVDDTLDAADELSSLGGERPKFSLRLDDGSAWLVKFSPPLTSEAGRRWADILRVELHAAETARAHGLDAVRGFVLERSNRAFLVLERFDRVAGKGRRGAATWFWLGSERYGTVDPREIADGLRDDGALSADDHARFVRAHAFAAAMGNNDAHAGNYALAFDDDGGARLAPLYDLAPMALAPRHDELPDARLGPWSAPGDGGAREMVRDLAARVAGDEEISAVFRARWAACAAPSLR
ncbi:MAG: HipA domain-containing protein [Polyangiales bacterium]